MLELIRMGTSMASLYIWLKRFSFDISYMKYSSDLSLGESFAYLPPFISQILDFVYWTVLIFFIYFEWRDTENQQYVCIARNRAHLQGPKAFCWFAKTHLL